MCNAYESRVLLAYSPLPLLCKRLSPSPTARLIHPLSALSLPIFPALSLLLGREKTAPHCLCVMSLAICVLANSKKKKKQKSRNEDTNEDTTLSRFVCGLACATGLNNATFDLAAAFCSSSLITLIITKNSSRPKCEELSPPPTPHDKHLSFREPPRIPRLGCSLLCL